MISVPSFWRCSGSAAAFVERNEDGHVHLCRVVRTHALATVYHMESLVTLDSAVANRFRSQDCTAVETYRVAILQRSGVVTRDRPTSFHDAPRIIFTVQDGSDATMQADPALPLDTLAVACPTSTNTAVGVTLAGPRLDARATPLELSAILSGRFVVVGARVRACGATYTVVRVEVKQGHGGVALVAAGCRVRVNDTLTATTTTALSAEDRRGPQKVPIGLVGLHEELAQINRVFALARTSPGRSFGVLVHGPRGCGVRALVESALQCATASEGGGGCEVVPWSPSLDVGLVRHRSRGSVVALVLPHCERHLGTDDGTAAFAVRKLLNDVHQLTLQGPSSVATACARHSYQPAVVVLAFTHNYNSLCPGPHGGGPTDGLFSVVMQLTLPDANERAELLAAVRGVPVSACMDEAHALVGRTRAEVRMAGCAPPCAYRPPFKPVRWDDIGGLTEVKARLHKALVWPQRHPEVFERFGLTPPKGILLYGPPGCAKTTLVKALCSEGCFSLIYLDSATIISAYVGESERQLRAVFAQAAQQAPCIVFFDEVEVIGARRAAGDGGKDAENVRLLSTLLTEMDGFAASRGVCFVGATNVPHLIDDALLRPGRFDYLVHVPLPAREDRERILSLFLNKTAADVARIADAMEGYSGADISALCTAALLELDSLESLDAFACLQDRERMTSYVLSHVSRFKLTDYNTAALNEFHHRHTSSVKGQSNSLPVA